MIVEVLTNTDSVAKRAADVIAEEAWDAVGARGQFIMGVSSGRTPWLMLREPAAIRFPWPTVYVVQVDERIAPAGREDRNLIKLRESLSNAVAFRPEQFHAMPAESDDLEAAATCYAESLRKLAGSPALLDLKHCANGASRTA